ncbi:MAG: hypothetical protein DIZ80_00250 [endosymbiont of Galathealinum brachiosum]|uniref:Uncharacterized protein n=1 Tax=endosymbiont of Galathealinum brachiosum TaxID=2200906 RepID=A0A370DM10_9GAMM|nr:MAG: hypothetical protein DIZ80_00250 [endosymbiont of Galathealinum brachiosum]
MAAWIPLIKSAMPYVVQVLSIAVPAFTSRSTQKDTDDIIPEQIAELQSAATQNAESVKILAVQLKGSMEGVDAAAIKLQQELVFLRRLSFIAIVISVVSVLLAVLN